MDNLLIKTISVRCSDIYWWPYITTALIFSYSFAGRPTWLLGIFTVKDDFSSILGYRLLALYCKGTDIFFVLPDRSLVEDDFRFDTWISTVGLKL